MILKNYIAKCKEQNPNFMGDMEALLRIGIEYNQDAAFDWLKNEVITNILKRRKSHAVKGVNRFLVKQN